MSTAQYDSFITHYREVLYLFLSSLCLNPILVNEQKPLSIVSDSEFRYIMKAQERVRASRLRMHTGKDCGQWGSNPVLFYLKFAQ